MKVRFLWHLEENGLLVHPEESVEVHLLSDDGTVPAGDPSLTLEGEYWPPGALWRRGNPKPRSFSESFGQHKHAALTLRGLGPPPTWTPARITWRLRLDGLLFERGSWLWVSRKARLLRRVALIAIVFTLFVWALLIPNFKDYVDGAGGILALVVGGVGVASASFIPRIREWAWGYLLHGSVAALAIAASLLGLVYAGCGFTKVYNLSLATCQFGQVAVKPRSVALIWGSPQPEGCPGAVLEPPGPSANSTPHTAARGTPSQQQSPSIDEHGVGPHRKSEVSGPLSWLPWLNSAAVHCKRAVPYPFEDAWRESGECAPNTLSTTIDIDQGCSAESLAPGKATLSYSAKADPLCGLGSKSSADGAAEPSSNCETSAGPLCLYDKFQLITLEGLQGLELRARGHHEISEVSYERIREDSSTVLLPSWRDDPSGTFEYSLGGQLLGSVTLQMGAHPAKGQARHLATRQGLGCYRLTSTMGVESILLAANPPNAFTRSVVATPHGTVFAPICFEKRLAPAQGEVVFAAGWTPHTAPALEWPGAVLPLELEFRTHTGEWLGSIERSPSAVEPSTLCKVSVHSVDWGSPTRTQLTYALGAGTRSFKVTVPGRTELGSLAWRLVCEDSAWPPRPAFPRTSPSVPPHDVTVNGTARRLHIAETRVEAVPRAHPVYYFHNEKFVLDGCGGGEPRAPSDYTRQRADNEDLVFSKLYDCTKAGEP